MAQGVTDGRCAWSGLGRDGTGACDDGTMNTTIHTMQIATFADDWQGRSEYCAMRYGRVEEARRRHLLERLDVSSYANPSRRWKEADGFCMGRVVVWKLRAVALMLRTTHAQLATQAPCTSPKSPRGPLSATWSALPNVSQRVANGFLLSQRARSRGQPQPRTVLSCPFRGMQICLRQASKQLCLHIEKQQPTSDK